MPRADLLALTADDLAALTNRGTVKRAQKELESDEPKCQIAEDDAGSMTVTWSDGITCRFLPGKTIHDAVCSSGIAGISRHVVRSVLAYQRARVADAEPVAAIASESGPDTPVAVRPAAPGPGEVWDPGKFTDEDLIACFKKPAVAKARTRYEQGILVELTRGAKPTARFLDEACTVRFAVPGDLRYATADCTEALWSTWIPLAVWAFRELPADQLAGLIALQRETTAPPADLLHDLQTLLDEFCRDGLAGLAPSWSQRLVRIEQMLRDEGLVWPAELVLELSQQHDMYRQHDARFDPDQLVLMLGELIIRMRAIARGTTAVPQPLIRGTKSDRPTDIGGAKFTGVGLGLRIGRRHTTLRAYLQEVNSGTVVAVERTFADPAPESGTEPKSFADLAATVLVRGVSLAGLATSHLLLQSGKRTPGGQLILPRTASSMSVHPHNFSWDHFKPPFAAEGFAPVRARLRFLPPSYLRPRRPTENLHGIAVTGVERVRFDVARQLLTAELTDSRREKALLVHPFHHRGAAGFNAFAETLESRGGSVHFVCGHVRSSGQGLVIEPVLLIVDDGSSQVGVGPWVGSRQPDSSEQGAGEEESVTDSVGLSMAEGFLPELQQSLAEVLLTGLVRDTSHSRVLAERRDLGRRLGFVQVADAVGHLADELASRANSLHWDPARAIGYLQHLCAITRIGAA